MEPNDHNGLLEADAAIDRVTEARERNRVPHQDRKLERPAMGSSAQVSASERSPLLGASRSSGASGNGDNSGEPVQWFGTAELKALPWWKRPSIWWLIPPFLLFTIAFGGIVVPKVNLIVNLICNDYYDSLAPGIQDPMNPGNEYDRCQTDDVSSRASIFLLYAATISGILSAITSPTLGALSDRYGRKKLLILTTCGLLVGEVITILVASFPNSVDVYWMLLGYAIDGFCGSAIMGMALAHSYTTDCTAPQKRNVAFGYFHACLFTGIAIGPLLSAYLIKVREPIVGKTDAVLTIFYIALACHGIFILFLLLVIPESLSMERQEAARLRHRQEKESQGPNRDFINQLRNINLLEPLKILYPTGPGSSPALRRNLVLLAATDTIVFSVALGAGGVITLYVRRQFDWQEWETSKYVSIVNICRVFGLLVILPLVTRLARGKQGTSQQANSGSDKFDLGIIRVAILFDVLGYLGYSLSRDGNMFILSGAVASFGGMGSPALGSSLTKHVPPDRVGQLLGAMGLLHAFARIIGPIIFNGIYSRTVYNFRQTVFVCLTATFGLAVLCSWFVRPYIHLDHLEPDGSPSSAPRDPDEEVPEA